MENPTAILKLWKQEAQVMARSQYKLQCSDSGISTDVSSTRYVEEMKGSFTADCSGLELAK